MSIYSGFATRQLQQQYDTLLYSLVVNMQRRILKYIRGEQSDDSGFYSVLRKLYHAMRKMEKYKYLEPKMSQSFKELVDLIELEHKTNGRMTEEKSIRDFEHVPLNAAERVVLSLTPDNFLRSKSILDNYSKEVQFNPYQFGAQKPLTNHLIQGVPTHPSINRRGSNNRSAAKSNHEGSAQEIKKDRNLKFFRVSRNIRIGTSMKNRTINNT